MSKWWLERLQNFLQSTLDWIKAVQGKSPRSDANAFLQKDVHVPTPIVATGALAALFIVLVPRVGFNLIHLLALAGILTPAPCVFCALSLPDGSAAVRA